MEDQLTNNDSLKLISKMIATAKGNISQGAFHMLLWGWVIVFVSTSHFLLLKFQLVSNPQLVWLLLVPTLGISFFVGRQRARASKVISHFDNIYKWIWLALVINMSLMLVFLSGKWDIIAPMVLLMAGYATFLSGKIIKFKPMVLGGIGFWIWAIIAYFLSPYYGLLITAAAIFTGYIIPGMLLQRKVK